MTLLIRTILLLIPLLLIALTASAESKPTDATGEVEQVSDNQKFPEQAPVEQLSAEKQTAVTEEKGLGLRELVDTESLSKHWSESLNEFMDEYNLSSSFVGKSIASIIIAIAALIIFFLLKRFLKQLLQKATNTNKINMSHGRVRFYTSSLINILLSLVSLVYVLILAGMWIENTQTSFVYEKLSNTVQFIASVSVLFILGALAFESVSTLVDRFFDKWGQTESTRLQTLLPIARNAINIAIFILFGITFISELGINIMPLLAGAGVIGFAIGFGAQTLVKDIITGFIIIFEDLIQIGDVVAVGGKSGLVEKITIRKVQLRSLDGVVSTIPFSEISIVENMTKEYSYYLLNVGIAYRESPDEVIAVLRTIGDEMQKDDEFKDLILEPIEILGVDAFADSAIIIKARIKTLPIKQWQVGREFNRRMKYHFDEAGIEIPFPHRTIYFGEGKDGKSPSASIRLKSEYSANDTQINNSETKN